MTSFVYNSCLEGLISGKIDFENGDFKCILVTDLYTPNRELHSRISDLTGEARGPGYPSGGVDVEVYTDKQDDQIVVSLRGFTINPTTLSANGAVYCNEDLLIAFIDFGQKISSYNGPFVIRASTMRLAAKINT